MTILIIMGKEAKQMLIITAAFLAAFVVFALLGRLASERLFVTFAILLSGIYVLSSVLISERYEDRHNGYALLLRMPVLPVEVATGKFGVMFIANLLACGLMLTAVQFYGFETAYAQTASAFVLLFGSLWLLIIASMYTGICLLGYTKFLLYFRIALMAFLVLAQVFLLLLFRAGPDGSGSVLRIIDGVTRAPWTFICIVVGLAYFAYVPQAGRLMRYRAAS